MGEGKSESKGFEVGSQSWKATTTTGPGLNVELHMSGTEGTVQVCVLHLALLTYAVRHLMCANQAQALVV